MRRTLNTLNNVFLPKGYAGSRRLLCDDGYETTLVVLSVCPQVESHEAVYLRRWIEVLMFAALAFSHLLLPRGDHFLLPARVLPLL